MTSPTMACCPAAGKKMWLGAFLLMETSTSAIPGIAEARMLRTCHESAGSYPNVRFSEASTASWLGKLAAPAEAAGAGAAVADFALAAGLAAAAFLGAGP